jgi:hypothetical protein
MCNSYWTIQAYDLLGLYFGIGRTFFNPESVSVNSIQVIFTLFFPISMQIHCLSSSTYYFQGEKCFRSHGLTPLRRQWRTTIEATPSLNCVCHHHMILLFNTKFWCIELLVSCVCMLGWNVRVQRKRAVICKERWRHRWSCTLGWCPQHLLQSSSHLMTILLGQILIHPTSEKFEVSLLEE